MQMQALLDVKLLKEGKQPPTYEEFSAQLEKDREEAYQKKIDSIKAQESSQIKQDDARKPSRMLESSASSLRDQLIMGTLAAVWIGLILYFNS